MSYFAMLSACGWLLFTPPIKPVPEWKTYGVLTNAPLSEWKQEMAFDSAKECEEMRKRITATKDNDLHQSRTVWEYSRCIPTELTGKLLK